jgi:hypothetical protein
MVGDSHFDLATVAESFHQDCLALGAGRNVFDGIIAGFYEGQFAVPEFGLAEALLA